MSDTLREPLEGSSNPTEDVSKTIASPLLDPRDPRRSGRIVRALDQFIFLGDVVFDKLDLDHSSYNKAISDKDSRN